MGALVDAQERVSLALARNDWSFGILMFSAVLFPILDGLVSSWRGFSFLAVLIVVLLHGLVVYFTPNPKSGRQTCERLVWGAASLVTVLIERNNGPLWLAATVQLTTALGTLVQAYLDVVACAEANAKASITSADERAQARINAADKEAEECAQVAAGLINDYSNLAAAKANEIAGVRVRQLSPTGAIPARLREAIQEQEPPSTSLRLL